MKRCKKWISLLMAGMLVTATLAGCGNSGNGKTDTTAAAGTAAAGTESAVDAGTGNGTAAGDRNIVFGLNNTWGSVLPFENTSTYTAVILDTLYEPLVMATDHTETRAAESIDVSEDGLLWTVHLNPACVWSDGEPCTAEDWVWTLQSFTSPEFGAHGSTYRYSQMEGTDDTGLVPEGGALSVERVDEYTFTIGWKRPTYVDEFVGTSAKHFCAVPKHMLEDIPLSELESNEFWRNPVTNGCCTIVEETVAGQEITLAAKDEYYLGAPDFDRLTFRVVATSNAANAMVNGDIDVFYPVLSYEVNQEIVGQNGIHIIRDMSQRTVNCMPINNSRYNANVRRALNMLIDKKALAMLKAGEDGVPAGDPYLMYMDYYKEYTHERDVEGAKALLDEENFDYDNTVITLGVGDSSQNVGMIIQQNLAEAGVQVDLRVGEATTVFADQAEGNIDALIISYREGFSPTYLSSHFAPATDRYTHTEDTRFAELAEKINACTDETEKLELTQEMQQLFWDECPWIFLYSVPEDIAFSAKVGSADGVFGIWKWKLAE